MLYLLLFLFGIGFGSFLNVVSLRYEPGDKFLDRKIIGGRSRCPYCGKTLTWYELVPILSYFFLGGKCRHCKEPIILQYIIVEILSGLIFVFVPYNLTNLQSSIFNLQFLVNGQLPLLALSAVWILIFLLFLLLSIIDFRHLVIPDQINLALGILGLILIYLKSQYGQFGFSSGSFLGHYAGLFGLRENIWINHFFALALGVLAFGAIIVLSKGRAMGWGDFKLIAGIGLIFGWPDTLILMMLSFIVGALLSVYLVMAGEKSIKDAVPFGPFLVVGATLVFFFGFQIMEGYFRLFGV